jgi:hypothetical protein
VPDALDVAQAILDMLEDGEATRPASSEAAGCLDVAVGEDEVARADEPAW